MKWSVCARAVLAVLVLGALAVRPVSAQITTGTVTGTVKDEQGLPVPGASVTRQRSRGTRMAPVVTSANGDFVVPNITPDTYTVEVAMDGFKSLRRNGIALSGGDRVGIGDLAISVGGTSETITVTSKRPSSSRRAASVRSASPRPKWRTCRLARAATSPLSRRSRRVSSARRRASAAADRTTS